MKSIKLYSDFNEGYLISNYAPLYHRTNVWYFESIIKDNKLKVSNIKNPFFKDEKFILSFSRIGNLDISKYKDDLDVIICLDKYKMVKTGYKFIPYDFFIQSDKEDKPKSNNKRNMDYEFEEVCLENISDIMDYIISVNFVNNSFYDCYNTIDILINKEIEIYEDGTRLY